jgi:hypothetical protein
MDKVPKSAKRPQPKGGSRKGVPNKATATAREAIARFVDGNSDKLQDWLDQIAQKDGPKAAFACFTDLLEYHVPKLSRAEVEATVTHRTLDQELAALNAHRDPEGNPPVA